MALVIRLRQQGRRNRPFYRVVVADSRSPRDGKCVETIGWYNPLEEAGERQLSVAEDRVQHWLDNGAQMSENVHNLIAQVSPDLIQRYRTRLEARRASRIAKRKGRRAAAAG